MSMIPADFSDIPLPEVRYTPFLDLRFAQRQAAETNLNYTAETWNNLGTNAIEQETYATNAATVDNFVVVANGLELSEITWDCYINHYAAYEWSVLDLYNVTEHWEILGYNEGIWNGTDTTTPASSLAYWADLTAEERGAATNLCYTQNTWDGIPLTSWNTAAPSASPAPTSVFYDNANERYTEYDMLGCTEKDAATTLQYTKETWNNVGSNPIELDSWYTNLPENGGSIPDFVEAAYDLTLNEETWDCWINHYGEYDWSELVQYNISQYWEGLGWTIESWNEDSGPPASEDKFWMDLSEEEQAAADALCYFQETWDEIPLTLWKDPIVNDDPCSIAVAHISTVLSIVAALLFVAW